jgi:hypothetical protein
MKKRFDLVVESKMFVLFSEGGHFFRGSKRTGFCSFMGRQCKKDGGICAFGLAMSNGRTQQRWRKALIYAVGAAANVKREHEAAT